MCSDDFEYPDRDTIRAEILKITDFSEEEVENLGWDKLYEIYGRVARYGEEGIEDEYREE